MDGFFMDVNPIPVKEAMWQMGLISTNCCRLPLTSMPEAAVSPFASFTATMFGFFDSSKYVSG